VTDASAPAGAAPGRYRLGEQDADLTEDGRVVLSGTDKLAGSALKMNDGVANLMLLGGLSLREAIDAATVNPAGVIGLEARMKGLTPGELGDVVTFHLVNGAVVIEDVFVSGVKLP
jgi:N-acetylglucosamine-6-phosphate deacetylase